MLITRSWIRDLAFGPETYLQAADHPWITVKG